MSVIHRLASSLDRNDELPNQELAKELCRTNNAIAIAELVQHLFTGNNAIKSDCIKVLYEIGEAGKPELIAPYADEFIKLLKSNNNRLIWGAMTALSTIAPLVPEKIFKQIDIVLEAIQNGSVITVDQGISVLAKVGSMKEEFEKAVLPFLLNHLEICKPREVAQHSERSMIIINLKNKEDFRRVLTKRFDDLIPSQLTRVKKVLKKMVTI